MTNYKHNEKQYLEPAVEVMEFDSEILMNSTSEGETTEGGTADEEGEGGDYAIHRRSSWGDLWN